MNEYTIHRDEDSLSHYGVPGTKWGVRRYQNKDGSYKPGAEGRYYQPIPDSVRKIAINAATKTAAKAAGAKIAATKMASSIAGGKSVSGGGGGTAAKKEAQPINKTVLGKDIDVKDVSEKLDTSSSKEKKSSTKKAKDESAGNEEFKLSQLEDKINNLFDMDDMKDEDWEDMDLDQSDIDEIDDLITKYRAWRKGNKSNTKKLKKIDEFIERYESWKSSHSKHSEMRELYLMHHGIKGQRWGIRRYQNDDGSYTQAGKERYGGDNKVSRHETTWYKKEKQNHPDRHHIKDRVSKSDSSELNKKLKLRDQQTWGKQNHLEDHISRLQETYKKHGYDVSKMDMFESREVNAQKQLETRIARREILDRREATEQAIHDLLENEELVEEIQEEAVEEGKSFLETVKDFFKKIF